MYQYQGVGGPADIATAKRQKKKDNDMEPGVVSGFIGFRVVAFMGILASPIL